MNDLVYTKRFFRCLACGEGEMSIEHVVDREGVSWGPWFCRQCGEGHRGTTTDGAFSVQRTNTSHKKTAVLLRLEPDPGTVYLVVEGMMLGEGDVPKSPWYDDDNKYYYEEHTCPTNYLRSANDILQVLPEEKSADPHGIFTYVATAPVYKDNGERTVQQHLDMFKLAPKVVGLAGIAGDEYDLVKRAEAIGYTFDDNGKVVHDKPKE
jgi:hypothetical protein